MIHKMHLNNEPFDLIKNGSKTIELRLNDEKRRIVKVGDSIEFINRLTKEQLVAEVIDLHYFDNFDELYKHFDKTVLGYKKDESASGADLEEYYSISEQEKYGVVGIELRKIS